MNVARSSVEDPGAQLVTVEVRPRLGRLAEQWDTLVDAAPLPTPFLRSWWLEAVAGSDPQFVLCFEERRLVGGIALEADRPAGIPRLRAIGTILGADHLDMLSRPDRRVEVVSALAGWSSQRGSRLFDLTGVSDGAQVEAVLPGLARRTQFDVAPWRVLEPEWVDRIWEEPGELRHLLLRPWRRLERAGIEHRVIDPAESAGAVARLRRLHEAQWGEQSEFLPAFHLFERAVPQGLERGELVIHELATTTGETIASQVWFIVAGRLSYVQGARSVERRWRGAGTVLMARAVEHGAAHGCGELDLLRGDDPYKRLWADRSRALYRIEAVNGLAGRAAFAVLPFARAARGRWRRWQRGSR